MGGGGLQVQQKRDIHLAAAGYNQDEGTTRRHVHAHAEARDTQIEMVNTREAIIVVIVTKYGQLRYPNVHCPISFDKRK